MPPQQSLSFLDIDENWIRANKAKWEVRKKAFEKGMAEQWAQIEYEVKHGIEPDPIIIIDDDSPEFDL